MKLTPDTVVFVTGGASGLGEETARHFHSQGCKVAIADMNTERMEMIKSELQERIITFQCDVTVEEDVKKAMESTAAQWGSVHVALACAGVAWTCMTLTSKTDLDTERFKKVMEINVYGSIYVAKYAAVLMAKNQPLNERGERGVILFVSSVAAEEGQRGQIAYSASKGAINGLVLPMARDLGKFGIRCAAIAPGIFHTAMSDKMPKKVTDRLNKDTPMGRPGQPDEFAHFAKSIVENGYVNGVHLRLDGAVKLSHM